MGVNPGFSPIIRALTDQQRAFVLAFVKSGDGEHAKTVAGYSDKVHAHQLLGVASVASAVRYEVARQMATEGAQIGYGALKRLARDTQAPAAAQVAAAKALLQGAGLLDAPQQDKESKSINDMTREELHTYIESKRADIDKMEAALADRARDVTPGANTQPLDMLE